MDHISIITGNVFSILRITVHEDGFSDRCFLNHNTYHVTQVKVVVQLLIHPCQTIKIDS